MDKIVTILITKAVGLYINLLSYILPDKALDLAYGFFSNPRKGKLTSENLPDVLKDAYLETLDYNNQYFQTYTWQGNNTKILLVHGWESNTSRWEHLLPYLKKSGSTIISLDAPAHGLSAGKEFDVPTYGAFIHKVSQIHKPQFIIGHSMGGVACTYFQHHYSNDYLQKMVLLGSPSEFKILMNNFINLLSLNSRVNKLLDNYIKQRFSINIKDFSGHHFLINTTIQGIIAHDKHDEIVSIEEAKKLSSAWKNAAFIETQGLGHSMHGPELYTAVYQFLFEK